MNPCVRRPPMLKKLAAETATGTVTTGGPERRIKGWPLVHIFSSQCILSSPLFNLHPLSWTWAAAGDCNGAQATWRCRSWEVYNRHHESTIRTVHFVAFPPLDPPLIRPFAHHARPCFYTQVSHIKAEGCLCLSRGFGKKTDVRSRVDLGRCTIVTRSLRYVLYTLLHSPPPLDPPLIRPFAHHARPCFYTQVSHTTAEGCLCLSRGVGKKTDVRSGVDSVFLGGSSEVSRYPGSSDESPGDWHSYPSRTQEAEKAQLTERSRGLEPGVLPLMAGTRRCCVSS
jgi:hypothetical protein